MRQFLVGLLVGMSIAAPPLFALRIDRPAELHEWNTNTFTQLNNILLGLWNITNGRYTLDTVTTTPKGNRKGGKGEVVFFDTGTDQICVNVSGTINSWSCVNLTPL